MYCLLHSASAEPGLAVIGRRCWCAPTMDVTGLSTTMPSSPGEIQIISTGRMQETFVVEIHSYGVPSAQFKVMPKPYNFVDISFQRPGAFCQLQLSLYQLITTIENVNLITYIWFLWSIVWHTIDVSGQYVVFHPAPSLTNRHRRLPPVTAPATKLRSAFVQMLPSSLLCYKATNKDSIGCAPSCYLGGFKVCSQQGVAAEFKCHCCMQRPDSAPWQLPDGTLSGMPDGIQIIELPEQLPKTYDPCEHPPAERWPPVLAGTAAAVTRDYSSGRALRPTGLGGNDGRLTVCTEVRLADWTAGRFDMGHSMWNHPKKCHFNPDPLRFRRKLVNL